LAIIIETKRGNAKEIVKNVLKTSI